MRDDLRRPEGGGSGTVSGHGGWVAALSMTGSAGESRAGGITH